MIKFFRKYFLCVDADDILLLGSHNNNDNLFKHKFCTKISAEIHRFYCKANVTKTSDICVDLEAPIAHDTTTKNDTFLCRC